MFAVCLHRLQQGQLLREKFKEIKQNLWDERSNASSTILSLISVIEATWDCLQMRSECKAWCKRQIQPHFLSMSTWKYMQATAFVARYGCRKSNSYIKRVWVAGTGALLSKPHDRSFAVARLDSLSQAHHRPLLQCTRPEIAASDSTQVASSPLVLMCSPHLLFCGFESTSML